MWRIEGWISKVLILLAFAAVLGVPWLYRPETAREPDGAARLVIITPHNEQIRYEFAAGFDRWHRARHGSPAVIDWRQPGGTTEIRRLLVAQYTAAIETGRLSTDGVLAPGAEPMPYDMLFGGGTFEHGEIKRGVRATPAGSGEEITMQISIPLGYDAARLEEWYGPGEHVIGVNPLYDPGDPKKNDPGQYWLGNAVSGFGIVFNRDVLRAIGVDDPRTWSGLTDPRLTGWVALADPRQSGSVATTYESILYSYGWDDGWKILRAMSANARYFANSAPKIPLDVSQGQAAVGTAIDFYGRYQSQAVRRQGESAEESRVGYIDPPGETLIDPDPISILRAGPNEALARRFIEYLLSEEGQAIWNFAEARGDAQDGRLGPAKYEIRRLPIRRVMYTKHTDRFIDKVNPYEVASKSPNKGWRSAIGPMMGAFAIDTHEWQTRAWRAIESARQSGASSEAIAAMERAFYAWPLHTIPGKNGAEPRTLEFNEANYRDIRGDWREAEKDGRMTAIRLEYTRFFEEQYRRVVKMVGEGARAPAQPNAGAPSSR